MSNKLRPRQYADQKGAIVEDFDGNIIEASGSTVPADATAGFAPGCTWYKRGSATPGQQQYINEGTATSCAFKAVPSQANAVASPVAGVAAGYKIARGIGALDGSNPTPITTGLATIVSAVVSLEGTTISGAGLGTTTLTVDPSGYATGVLNVYAWKPTSNANPTLVASTGTDNFHWVAVGT